MIQHDFQWYQLWKFLSGDIDSAVDGVTADVTGATDGATTQTFEISLVDSSGNVYEFYNGPIKLAISDTSTNGTAAIDPTSTTPDMTNGKYTVSITFGGTWVNGETATLTISDPDSGIIYFPDQTITLTAAGIGA
jgi:hypothetical protein